MRNLLEEFWGQDEDGNTYRVEVWQTILELPPNMSGRRHRAPGPIEAEIRGHGAISMLDRDTFRILQSGAIVRRMK
ncbi:hypothetical protein DWF04_015700 [Cereibacter sphaeroides f. sp. denitrificans]|nr:hypothetical protein DWF04_16230 [Cereibacter sphaeroides f. sp. denitrificans]